MFSGASHILFLGSYHGQYSLVNEVGKKIWVCGHQYGVILASYNYFEF